METQDWVLVVSLGLPALALFLRLATLLRKPRLKVVSADANPRTHRLDLECTHVGSRLGYSGVCEVTVADAVFDETTRWQRFWERLKFWHKHSPQGLKIYCDNWRTPHRFCYPDPPKISVGDTSKFSVFTDAIWNWEEMSSCEQKMREALPKKTFRIGIRDSLGNIHWADRKTTDGIREVFCRHIAKICREAEQTRNRSTV